MAMGGRSFAHLKIYYNGTMSIQPWQHWYHAMFSTYGQWLRGDPRGWRERHHRLHCDGDYRNPPPADAMQRLLYARSRRLLKRTPVVLSPKAQAVSCEAIRGKLDRDGLNVAALAVCSTHAHVIVGCCDH
jgi:hypothetical protein